MFFQQATSEAAGRAKKPTAQYLMPHNKHLGKQDCNCQFHDHKIFNPCKHRTVYIHSSVVVYVQCISFQQLFVASLSTAICQLLLISLLVVLITFVTVPAKSQPQKQNMRAPMELCRAKVPFNNEEEAGGPQLHQSLSVEEGSLEGVAGEDRGVWPPEPGHQQDLQDAESH